MRLYLVRPGSGRPPFICTAAELTAHAEWAATFPHSAEREFGVETLAPAWARPDPQLKRRPYGKPRLD